MSLIDDVYDLISIGSGPAGESATELAAFFGYRCLIIEKDAPGGTVTTSGGVPTKTLREAALYFSGFRDRDIYGFTMASPPEIMLDAIRQRTWKVGEALQEFTADNIRKRGIDLIHGKARLGSNRTVIVQQADGAEKVIQGKAILIATGSRPAKLECGLPTGHPGLCDTDTVLKRGRPPKVLVIVGGGPVAVEFATIARTLDIDVTIVSKGDHLLTSMDGEISDLLREQMSGWGVKFELNTTIQTTTDKNDSIEITLENGKLLTADTILFAAGRVGNTDGLNLESAGVVLDAKGRISVDEKFQTNAEGIYAAGDVIGPTLASVAMDQGRVAVCHAFAIPVEGVIDTVAVSAVYSMPEVARVGLTEEECIKQGLNYQVGRSNLSETPRGAIAGRGGLLKLLFLKDSRKLIGVHCIGDLASEIVGIGQMAIRCGATIHTFSNMTLNTPTYSYAYKYAAFDGIRRLLSKSKSSENPSCPARVPDENHPQGRSL